MTKILNIIFIFIFLTLYGCASVTGTTGQSISVETRSDDGQLAGADCELSNSKGKWFVKTPGSTQIRRSNDDLIASCSKKGYETSQKSIVSDTKGAMFGNIILGGGIGALVDHNSGAAYEYPTLIQLFLNKTSNQDTSTNENKSPAMISTNPSGKISPDVAQQKCTDLGFKSGTEDYARCVLRLGK